MSHTCKTPVAAGVSRGSYPSASPILNTASADYRNRISFEVDGRAIRLKGGRARLLDMLIAAGTEGVDRIKGVRWFPNVGDTARALRIRYHIKIDTILGNPTRYVLRSNVKRMEAQL